MNVTRSSSVQEDAPQRHGLRHDRKCVAMLSYAQPERTLSFPRFKNERGRNWLSRSNQNFLVGP